MDNNKKDSPGNPKPGGSGPGSSRPHATLDLKATEVKPPETKAADVKGAEAKTTEAKTTETKAAESQAADTKATDSKAGAAKDAKKPTAEDAKSAAAKAPAGAAKPGDAKPAAPKTPAPARTGGTGGFFTHLAAGLAGGIIALLAADMLANQLGLTRTGENGEAMVALQERLSALETAGKDSSDLPTRVASVEAQTRKLDQLRTSLDRLSKQEGELAAKVSALESKSAAGTDAAVQERLTKLEDRLATMSAAAENDPQAGRLPQLAALTGKIADLESTMTNQLDALRKQVNQEIDTRFTAVSESSETARSGTQRIDRELAGLKAEEAERDARLNKLTADSERAATTAKANQEQIAQLKSDLDARLGTLAKPEDIATAVQPLTSKISSLEQNVQGVVKSEDERKATAGRIVLSLELGNLKRAIDRGRPFAPELDQAKKVAGDSIDLAPLTPFSQTGVPTLAELQTEFKSVAFKMIDAELAPSDGSIVDRLLAGAKSVVRVRKISHNAEDTSVEAVVSRMETALAEDRLGDVLDQYKSLPAPVQDAGQDFIAKVEARNSVDQALASVERQLKTSLVTPDAAPAGTAQE